eukprot:TRINITY_DN11770_c0_g1_i1.p1 TRINITY_DN11770_c0_g1~~TRINITY_DN11770_c0_g1_i1.p1  ORF type:complete len:230 (+),score=41.03 TRINITY_DN11770_c0_g1_i1:67-690(+)
MADVDWRAAVASEFQPKRLTLQVRGPLSSCSGFYIRADEESRGGGPLYVRQDDAYSLHAMHRAGVVDGRVWWKWQVQRAETADSFGPWVLLSAQRAPVPQEVGAWVDNSGIAVDAKVAFAALLSLSGSPLQDSDMTLCDAGVSGETELELLVVPPVDTVPCDEGPLVVYIRAPTFGVIDPVCLEVATDATVAGVAALAARMLQLEQD